MEGGSGGGKRKRMRRNKRGDGNITILPVDGQDGIKKKERKKRQTVIRENWK